MTTLVVHCRSGFERDAAAELSYHASCIGVTGQAQPNCGFAVFECGSVSEAETLIKEIDFKKLVFTRQWFVGLLLHNIPTEGIVSVIKNSVEHFPLCGALSVETPDTNEGKALSKFCMRLTEPLTRGLQKRNKLTRKPKPKRPVLHVMFLSNSQAYVGYSFVGNRSLFEMGIPRLKMPFDAPSRSTLKLDEAFHVFLPEEIADRRLRFGMTAVDLGACPGGWTYQLVRRGLFVTAIDNGEIQDDLLATGQVEHLKEDGFKYRPKKKGDNLWLVCDMVEKPSRVTQLMLDWIVEGHAKELIFNLKLPMKKRYEAVYECLDRIKSELSAWSIDYEIQAKHLYHDREEISLYIHVV